MERQALGALSTLTELVAAAGETAAKRLSVPHALCAVRRLNQMMGSLLDATTLVVRGIRKPGWAGSR